MGNGSLPASPELLEALKEVNKEASKLIDEIEKFNNPNFTSGAIYEFASRIFTKGYNYNNK